ncbi:MAG: hypothetical protein HY645_11295 [Acidobacteria bacterium]|nr:hypothetical protein [Acidobacteriota bacterium]
MSRLLQMPLLGWWSSRILLFLIAGLGLKYFDPLRVTDYWRAFPENVWLDGWARWDSGWYYTIWERGYFLSAEGFSNLNFPPLYPFVSGVLSWVLADSLKPDQAFYLAGITVSNLSFIVALVLFHEYARRCLDWHSADRSVWLLCFFPFSFFFGAAYSESLYLALALWSFHLADEQQWGKASLVASLAPLARIQGVLVILGIAGEYLRRREYSFRAIRLDIFKIPLACIPFLAFLSYEWVVFGPMANVAARERGWGPIGVPRIIGQIELLAAKAEHLQGSLLEPEVGGAFALAANAAMVVPAFFLSLYSLHRFGAGLGSFALGSVVMGFFLNGFESFGRYMCVVFPLFMSLGALSTRRIIFLLVLFLFAAGLFLLTFYFTHWYHVV